VSIKTRRQRLALSLSVVVLAYLAFGVWAHLTDPRWPPLAFGTVRQAVELLTWPGVRIGTVLVLTGTNPFPSGATYLSIWGLSMGAYVLLLFGGLSVAASLLRNRGGAVLSHP
jgi:hypothetical protein